MLNKVQAGITILCTAATKLLKYILELVYIVEIVAVREEGMNAIAI